MHFYFFFNDTATTEIYTLSLHDALPISLFGHAVRAVWAGLEVQKIPHGAHQPVLMPRNKAHARGRRIIGESERRDKQVDRKSTRLNSSHGYISYAVFCLKKKKNTTD